jgi:hypothetical protein
LPYDAPAAAGGHLVATRSWHTQLGRPAGRRQSVGRRDHIMQMHGRACSARAVYWCCPSITTRLGGPGALRRDVGSRAVPALVGSGGAGRIIGDLIELLRRTGIGVLYRGVTAASNQQRQGRHAQDRSSDCRHDRPPFVVLGRITHGTAPDPPRDLNICDDLSHPVARRADHGLPSGLSRTGGAG